eukprot:TRINITY_DN2728_c1_g1_i1.p1 TRINITY_DN2728_c1_g1~~TRINITY_DN2728_c1_g1_i1.p1  ORF type:complete len:252 (-),score=24.73 TRINITY_DN2728_c1_g1_i1:692-1447(-)
MQTRASRRAQIAAANPLLDPMLAQHILAFLRPSLMIRSTCRAFRSAIEAHEAEHKHHTVAADAVYSARLTVWAACNGLDPKLAQAWCASYGNLEGLRRLRSVFGLPLNEISCCRAARGGHLETLQGLRQSGSTWCARTCRKAAHGGHLELLQLAHANGCPSDELACAKAAGSGHLEILQWLRVNGCPWDETTCSFAAGSGHLEELQWARANGCPWDTKTCSEAAIGGHLEVLQWARANGCPWDEWASDFAD